MADTWPARDAHDTHLSPIRDLPDYLPIAEHGVIGDPHQRCDQPRLEARRSVALMVSRVDDGRGW